MKISHIANTNAKGQVVIPKIIRDSLNIDQNTMLAIYQSDVGIYLQPIDSVVTKGERENSYVVLLKSTQGAWGRENWGDLRSVRKKLELFASKKRKSLW